MSFQGTLRLIVLALLPLRGRTNVLAPRIEREVPVAFRSLCLLGAMSY